MTRDARSSSGRDPGIGDCPGAHQPLIPFPGSFLWRTMDSLAKSSWVGVDLFFVLSGILITGTLYDTLGSRNYFRVFCERRFLRIFPLCYGFLFLVIASSRPLQIE